MSIIILIGGFVLIFIGCRKLFVSKSRERSWLSAQGRIYEVRMTRNWGGKKIYTPVVGFQNPQGQQIFFNSGGAQIPFYHQGQDVAVVYNPQNHSQAEIKGAMQNWFWITFFIILGGGMFFLGIVAMILELSFYYSKLTS